MAVDLYCGLGGWAEGFLSEGYSVVGFDIERRPYPGQLVLQDALTIHGSQFRDATALVASPPCQAYSYMAMPWQRAKAMAAEIRADASGEKLKRLNALFDACFRIQREACEAAGRYIPIVVENVKGAQPWVGPAKWHYGSFYLWGDVPALMPFSGKVQKINGYSDPRRNGGKGAHLTSQRESDARKNGGGSWFAIAHNTESGLGHNPDGRKIANPNHNGNNSPVGTGATSWFFKNTKHEQRSGVKVPLSGRAWFADGLGSVSSCSEKRKQASAEIAKIPFPLAQHIAATFKPYFTSQPSGNELERQL